MTVFHRLSIAAIDRDTPDTVAVTFHIPELLREQYRYRPGQHLTLKAAINGENLRRCYSICSAPDENELKIGVKAIYEGRFSNFINQQLNVGDSLEVMVPQGQFGYQPDSQQNGDYLAVAAGSGITPLLSIIKATLQTETGSHFVLIYGNRTSRSVMFKEAIADLKTALPPAFKCCTYSAKSHKKVHCSVGVLMLSSSLHWENPYSTLTNSTALLFVVLNP